MKKLSYYFNKWSSVGLKLPYAFDKRTNGPSVTLFFAYVSFLLTVLSIVFYHLNQQLLFPCLVTLGFWVIAMVFYLIRTGNIKKAKFDLDDKSLEIEGEGNDTKN